MINDITKELIRIRDGIVEATSHSDGTDVTLPFELVSATYETLALLTFSLLLEAPATQEQEQSDSVCKEADGCPTELAVLQQRYWREHQQQGAISTKTHYLLMRTHTTLCEVLQSGMFPQGSGIIRAVKERIADLDAAMMPVPKAKHVCGEQGFGRGRDGDADVCAGCQATASQQSQPHDVDQLVEHWVTLAKQLTIVYALVYFKGGVEADAARIRLFDHFENYPTVSLDTSTILKEALAALSTARTALCACMYYTDYSWYESQKLAKQSIVEIDNVLHKKVPRDQ